jgi:hypothetical protein
MLCEDTLMIEIVQFSVLGVAFSDASSSMKLLCPTLSPFLKLLISSTKHMLLQQDDRTRSPC